MLVAINYADENFSKFQKYNTRTAYKYGKADKVIEYSPKDIDNEFYEKHKKVLSYSRGGGYWLWKPYIILETMKKFNDGDYIFYCDSGAFYVNKIQYLINDLEKSNQDIMVFQLPLAEKQFTKKEVFEYLNVDLNTLGNTNQIAGTYILLKISKYSRDFFEKYLNLCQNELLVTDNHEYNIQQHNSFIAHRHDQSLLSMLSKTEKITPFRDPSQFGIRPWEYAAPSRIYNPKVYNNSTYPKIIISNRKANPIKFKYKEYLKTLLNKLGYLNQDRYFKKHNYILDNQNIIRKSSLK